MMCTLTVDWDSVQCDTVGQSSDTLGPSAKSGSARKVGTVPNKVHNRNVFTVIGRTSQQLFKVFILLNYK
jgi:hypothetical protein